VYQQTSGRRREQDRQDLAGSRYRDNYNPSYVEMVVPKKFRGHSLANLKPWPESLVPQVQQQKYIDLLRYRVDHDEEPEEGWKSAVVRRNAT
jgi:hypothetical protein